MTYVYQAVRRKKENLTSSDSKQYWEIACEGYNEAALIETLKRRVAHKAGVWRIYKSVNKRDEVKSKLMLLEILQRSLVYEDKRRVEAMWRTVLMQPENKAERLFLLDVDHKDVNISRLLERVQRPLERMVTTPNGFHVVVKPFDVRLVDDIENVEVKKDAFLFIEKFEVK